MAGDYVASIFLTKMHCSVFVLLDCAFAGFILFYSLR